MLCIPSLPLLSDLLWVVVRVKIPSINQIDLFKNYSSPVGCRGIKYTDFISAEQQKSPYHHQRVSCVIRNNLLMRFNGCWSCLAYHCKWFCFFFPGCRILCQTKLDLPYIWNTVEGPRVLSHVLISTSIKYNMNSVFLSFRKWAIIKPIDIETAWLCFLFLGFCIQNLPRNAHYQPNYKKFFRQSSWVRTGSKTWRESSSTG